MIQNIADFFLTIYRVSFKPQEVYRELDTVPGRRRQGWILVVLAVAAVIVSTELSSNYLFGDRAWYLTGYFFPPFTTLVRYYPYFFVVPSLVAGLLTLIWIALRVFPGRPAAWPALGFSLGPGVLVGGASFLLWLLALGLKSIWIQPLVFLSLGAFNPVLFSLAFPAAYVFEHGELVANVKRYAEYEYDLNSWARRLAETEQELWYWIPALLIMAGLALWQGWLIYTAARELGDNQQSHPAGLVLLYTLAINSPLALVGVFSIIAIIVISY